MYVAEAGFAYGGLAPQPRILEVELDGSISVVADRMLNGPITDIEFNRDDGLLYVSHRGAVSTIDATGPVRDVIVGACQASATITTTSWPSDLTAGCTSQATGPTRGAAGPSPTTSTRSLGLTYLLLQVIITARPRSTAGPTFSATKS